MFITTEVIVVGFIISYIHTFGVDKDALGISPASAVTYSAWERTVRMALEILTVVSHISIILFVAKHILYWIAELDRGCWYSFLVMMPCDSLNIDIGERILRIICMIIESRSTELIHLQMYDQCRKQLASDPNPSFEQYSLMRQ